MYQNLRIFLGRTTLTHITIDDAYLSDVLIQFSDVSTLPSIISFRMSLLTSPHSLVGQAGLDILSRLFPRLVKLQLTIRPDVEEDGAYAPKVWMMIQVLVFLAELLSAADTILPSVRPRRLASQHPSLSLAGMGLHEEIWQH
jgi:hypothetical protein